MRKLSVLAALSAAMAAPTAVHSEDIRARLMGYQEVPAVSTPAKGEFEAKISRDDGLIEYQLSYSGLLGTVQQSHIHFAQRGVNGSVVIWLCQTTTTPAPATVASLTPFCPPSPSGTVTGQITAANVIVAGTASQQILAGELAEVIEQLGRAVAKMHCVSDTDSDQSLVAFQTEEAIIEVIGDDEAGFVADIATFGLDYAATVRDDHRHFVEAFREGRIPGVTAT